MATMWKVSKLVFVLVIFASCVSALLVEDDLLIGGDGCNAIRIDEDRIVCACDRSNCGQLKLTWPERRDEVYLYQSDKSGARFALRNLTEDSSSNDYEEPKRPVSIYINTTSSKQTILGWGGAFTDAFGSNLNSLSADMQTKLLEAYFGPHGLRYNFGRVPIGGADFSSRAYSYDDLPSANEQDFDLKLWSLAKEDQELKIPAIRKSAEIAQKRAGQELKLFASPWSPAAWLKTSKSLVRGHLIDTDQVYKTYAEYLMKFYDAYSKAGIRFWGATVQNEAFTANEPSYFFNSMAFSPEEMIKFIGQYLGPALEARGYNRTNFKLMIGDDNVNDYLAQVVPQMLADQRVKSYISGLAFHWYAHEMPGAYEKLSNLYEAIRGDVEFSLMTEACEGARADDLVRADLGNWARGESYAGDIIEDLSRFASGWIDWNMALDMMGGPNWALNYVDSPVIVDAKRDKFYKQPMYYALAHFSRFFRPGFVVLKTTVVQPPAKPGQELKAIAALEPKTGHLVVTILNRSNEKKSIRMGVICQSGAKCETKQFKVDKRSFATLVMKL